MPLGKRSVDWLPSQENFLRWKKNSSIYFSSIVFKEYFFKILFTFRQRGREGDRGEKKYQCVVASHSPPTGDLARNPGMCPDWESNWWSFNLQPTLSPLSHTSQSNFYIFIGVRIIYYMNVIIFQKSCNCTL